MNILRETLYIKQWFLSHYWLKMVNFKELGQYKEMITKYKQLDKKLKSLVIRAKEWKYMEDWEEKDQVVIDISWEMKLKDLHINDNSLLDPSKKSELENLLVTAMQKAQNKAQEVVAQQTKDILWVDTNDLAWMLGGWLPGLS